MGRFQQRGLIMKLGLVSDLHFEHSNCDLSAEAVDVIIAAGDVLAGEYSTSSVTGVDWLLRKFPDPAIPVVYVPGNHEFENQTLPGTVDKLRRAAAGTHVHVLYNEAWVHEGVRFLGTTLWTDFDLFGEASRPMAMDAVKTMIYDFSCILREDRRPNENPFVSPGRIRQEHEQAVAWLEFQLRRHRHPDGPTVVVTHHAPSARSVAPVFAKNLTSAYYASRLDDLVAEANLWCHGHMHMSFDYRVGDESGLGRVVCNPRGNSKRFNLHQNSGFENPKVLHV